jgi:hypothetical protein
MTCLRIIARESSSTTLKEMFPLRGTWTGLTILSTRKRLDYMDAKMRLFAQSLSGDVRKWFKALPSTNIWDFTAFETSFLNKWGDKKNLLQLLTQYNNMKKSPEEIVQEFSTHFLKVYNSIPQNSSCPWVLRSCGTLILSTVISPCS